MTISKIDIPKLNQWMYFPKGIYNNNEVRNIPISIKCKPKVGYAEWVYKNIPLNPGDYFKIVGVRVVGNYVEIALSLAASSSSLVRDKVNKAKQEAKTGKYANCKTFSTRRKFTINITNLKEGILVADTKEELEDMLDKRAKIPEPTRYDNLE